MAQIRMSEVNIGEAYDVQVAFKVFRSAAAADVFEVRSPSYTVEQYTVAPALRPTGDMATAWIDDAKVDYPEVAAYGAELVSANVWPVSATTEVVLGGLYVLPPEVNIEVPCSARFLPDDERLKGSRGTVWSAVSGSERFDLVSSSPPELLGPDQYSRFDGRSLRWVDTHAVQFDRQGSMFSDEGFAIGSNRVAEQSVGVMMMLVMSPPPTDVPVVGFGPPGSSVADGVWMDPSQNIYLRDRYGVVGVLEYKLRWYGTPVCVSLSAGPDPDGSGWSAAVTVDSARSEPVVGKWKISKDRAEQMLSGSLLLFPGASEVSCEVLDLMVWRKGFDFADLLRGYNLFQNLYGI